MSDFFRVYFPRSSHKIIFGILLFFMSVYLIYVPVGRGVSIYRVFHEAGQNFRAGKDPYLYPKIDYKYGPSFLLFPLVPLSYLPLIPAAIIWQVLSLLVYLFGVIFFFKAISPDNFKPSFGFAFFFSLVLLFDLNTNGVYCQSNTLLAGLMLAGVGLYGEKKYFLSGMILAYASWMKVLPFFLSLILATELKKRYIVSYFVSLASFLLVVFSLTGFTTGVRLYRSWVEVLAIDRNLVYGPWVHFFLGLKAFFEANFGLVFHWEIVAMAAVVGILMAVVLFIKFRPYTKEELKLIVTMIFSYLLLFNSRTEGPSIVLMGPLYGIWLIGLYKNASPLNAKNIIWWGFLVLAFFLTSLSKTDLMEGTMIGKLSWKHNWRTGGMIIFFALSFISLFSQKIREVFFK
jgi:hypothetical protein